jgi:hypothetical protein
MLAMVALVCLLVGGAVVPASGAPGGGQSGQLRILRDEYGVPHVYAARLSTLFHGVGYAQGQDRLWQADIPVADLTRDRAHGRSEIRRLQVATVPGLRFPHATQALRITRRVRALRDRKWRTVTVYGLTSLTHHQASPPTWPTWSAALGHRGAAPDPRRHLRRGRLPGPHRQRAQGHGDLPQPGRRDPALLRPGQHRRRAAPQRPRCHPTAQPAWHHHP